jgi:hypothetical protein
MTERTIDIWSMPLETESVERVTQLSVGDVLVTAKRTRFRRRFAIILNITEEGFYIQLYTRHPKKIFSARDIQTFTEMSADKKNLWHAVPFERLIGHCLMEVNTILLSPTLFFQNSPTLPKRLQAPCRDPLDPSDSSVERVEEESPLALEKLIDPGVLQKKSSLGQQTLFPF